ncbi:MAG: c-type cytochrome [Pseudomonadota bacterium]
MHIAAKHCAVALVTASALLMGAAHAAGSPEAGQGKSAVCAACHGADGNSFNPEWPALAGQHASYIITQLEWFRSGKRQNMLMSSQAANLSDEDIKDLAAYFSSQTLKVPGAVEGTVTKGEKLYRGGNATTGLAACMGCHGPSGRGNPGALMPAVGGQQATYTANALKNYRSGEREHPIMSAIAQRLTDAEIDALAGYLQGLY